jgi:hypothetical protein
MCCRINCRHAARNVHRKPIASGQAADKDKRLPVSLKSAFTEI